MDYPPTRGVHGLKPPRRRRSGGVTEARRAALRRRRCSRGGCGERAPPRARRLATPRRCASGAIQCGVWKSSAPVAPPIQPIHMSVFSFDADRASGGLARIRCEPAASRKTPRQPGDTYTTGSAYTAQLPHLAGWRQWTATRAADDRCRTVRGVQSPPGVPLPMLVRVGTGGGRRGCGRGGAARWHWRRGVAVAAATSGLWVAATLEVAPPDRGSAGRVRLWAASAEGRWSCVGNENCIVSKEKGRKGRGEKEGQGWGRGDGRGGARGNARAGGGKGPAKNEARTTARRPRRPVRQSAPAALFPNGRGR